MLKQKLPTVPIRRVVEDRSTLELTFYIFDVNKNSTRNILGCGRCQNASVLKFA